VGIDAVGAVPGQEPVDLDFTVTVQSEAMRAVGLPPHIVSRGNARMLYWTVARMVAHHT
jgi:fumarylacetoacetase